MSDHGETRCILRKRVVSNLEVHGLGHLPVPQMIFAGFDGRLWPHCNLCLQHRGCDQPPDAVVNSSSLIALPAPL